MRSIRLWMWCRRFFEKVQRVRAVSIHVLPSEDHARWHFLEENATLRLCFCKVSHRRCRPTGDETDLVRAVSIHVLPSEDHARWHFLEENATLRLCFCKVSHRRCRPTGDETGVVAVVEFCCVIGTEVVHGFGAREPVVKSDPEPLSTPDCATGCVLAPEHACQISFNGVPRRGRRRMSDGSFACALRRSGCT